MQDPLLKKHKKDIDNFLEEQSFDFKNYDDFIEYIQLRGMINSNIKAINRIIFTKANLRKIYQEYNNPIKKFCKEQNLTYRELGNFLGFGEEAISKSARTQKISLQLETALNLFKENIELKEQIKALKILIK
ncbi:hypothetical protein [Campylobacter ureolyticus]|uniref:Uncharacterized protein n=1 Tax=Campylobacter ureolyticus TaxID=827 RepID=A0A6N2RX24_9BACT